jgi:hypothetical protein
VSFHDPRDLGGQIAGPGGAHDFGENVLDTRRAVLMEGVQVCQVDNPSDGRKFIALELEGRINQSKDRARVLYLFDADGAAALVSQLIGMAGRTDAPWAGEFRLLLKARLDEMP